MADVKWIKITTDIFDDEKILLIESLPEADSIIVIWFKLLCLAGKMNNSGVFMLNERLAYNDRMLATIFRRKEATVKMALETFERFGMVEIVDNVITIPNWGKHQNLDQLESKKEYMRDYMREYRQKQKAIASKTNCKTNSKANVSSVDKEEDKDKDKEGDIDTIEYTEPHEQPVSCAEIVNLYNSICVSFPRIKVLSESRKKAIRARLKVYSLEDFRALFQNAEESDFLKGSNSRNWNATFDWLIKDGNMAKVLDGNYQNRGKPLNRTAQELNESYEMMRQWAEEREET